MLRISAFGDDAVVGQIVPSTTVDPLKGTRITHPVSSSNVNNAGNVGKQDIIVWPT